MVSYIIVYESQGRRDAADAIHDAVKNYAHWGRVTNSCWVITTETKTAVNIRDEIADLIESSDRLLVVRSGTEAAWRNVKASSEWLKQHL
jgi:glutamate-1-semialdehyde aminotransferase